MDNPVEIGMLIQMDGSPYDYDQEYVGRIGMIIQIYGDLRIMKILFPDAHEQRTFSYSRDTYRKWKIL
jgi:hypothetical protein